MTLEVNLVGREPAFLAAEEVVERDLVKRGGRGKRRDVSADAGALLVRADDHHHRVPADDALDAAFQLAVAGVVGANILLGEPLPVEELLPFALEGEKAACGVAHAATRPHRILSKRLVSQLSSKISINLL